VFVKICGCRLPEDAVEAAAAGATAVGMVLVPGFRRSLAPDEARRLRAAVPRGVWAVGVFLDQALRDVLAAVRELRLDAVQLHGSEPEALAARLRRECRVLRGWKGLGPAPREADVLLAEPHAGRAGGLGEAWDWSRLAGMALDVPLVLSGGLTAENVAAACAAVRPWGVDVSSGVEVGGAKDPARMRAFCAAVRRWEAEEAAGAG
jgi:phosphoribosylanthranilate isomerase